jgi:hypothetical protein
MAFIGCIFSDKLKGKKGDFSYMINEKTNVKRLYIYNENVTQWASLDLNPGGGNAILRPYRYDHQINNGKWPRSIGIPTGPAWNTLNDGNKIIINKAFLNIEKILKEDHYEEIWWSANKDKSLGYSIFQPCDDVRNYILDKMKDLCKKKHGCNWENYFLYY